ncbi:MAG: transposase [Candidatus Gracilibacteria bacterium]|nr:transposase [Candidatus Gracilibacteria bacterium]
MGYKKEVSNITFKSKELEKLNKDLELLKNLSTKNEINIYFGFDIAKEFHYLSLVLEKDSNTKTYDIGEIKNNDLGFKNLEKVLEGLSKSEIDKNTIFIGMEATGSYHFSLIEFFNKKKYKNIYVVNPSKIKQFSKKDNNSNVKNDKKDSIMIAEFLQTYKNYLEKDEKVSKNEEDLVFEQRKNKIIHRSQFLETSNLRFLYRQYFKEKQELVRVKNRIKELTNRIMPEIYEVFNPNKYSHMELYIKSHFTRDEIVSMEENDFYMKVMTGSGNKEFGKKAYNQKLKKLQELLKIGVGVEDEYGLLKGQMNLFVKKYYGVLENIENMENLILAEISNNGLFIPKIYGVSPILLGVFYSEMGNHLFTKSLKELVGFIGWYPTQTASGGKTLSRPRLQNKGNYMLRKVIYLIIFTLTGHIKEVNKYKEKIKDKKGIKSKQALVESASKMIKIILSLFKNKQDFDLEKFKELNFLGE